MNVAIYCRLSEEDRNKANHWDDSASIRNQKAMLTQYALAQNWQVYKIYSDDDYTGADRNRPQFQQLIADAKAHKFDIVLCKTQSRFTRELELVEAYIHDLFPALGIRFISVVDNGDTDNKGNKKSRQINALINQWYLEDMSENIKSVLDSRRQQGLHIGSFALYGYEKDPAQKGHLIIDPEAAAVVRQVFTLFDQGYGKTAIARHLNQQAIPNPTQYKRQKGLRYGQASKPQSILWRYSSIASMLVNAMYAGHMVQGKYASVSYKTKQNKPKSKADWIVVEHTHQPIIDQGLWERVQQRLATNAKPFATGTTGIFARKVRCAYCGYTLGSSKNRGRYYLQCSTRHRAKDSCVGAFIAVDTLEQLVLGQWARLTDRYLDYQTLLDGVALTNPLERQRQHLQEHLLAL